MSAEQLRNAESQLKESLAAKTLELEGVRKELATVSGLLEEASQAKDVASSMQKVRRVSVWCSGLIPCVILTLE